MSQPSWKDEADRRSSDWLDAHEAGDSTVGQSGAQPPNGDEAESYFADLLLVDALLTNMSEDRVERKEQRVRRVMDAINSTPPAPSARVRLWRWSSYIAAAACVLLVVTLVWLQFEKHSLANEVLLAVREVSSKTTDRVYSITRVLPNRDDHPLPHGKLYLRGREGFVITWGKLALGRRGDQFWLVGRDQQQVTVSDSFAWIDSGSTGDEFGLRIMQELSLESRHVPLMQLASVAELMQHDYEVKLSRGQLAGREVDLLVGRRRREESDLPVTIRLWSDRYSRIIHKAELRWGGSNAIIMELMRSEPVAADWYEYQTHCDGAPAVRRIPSGS